MTAAKYNEDQWISSFEDEMLRQRPHMTSCVLGSITPGTSTARRALTLMRLLGVVQIDG